MSLADIKPLSITQSIHDLIAANLDLFPHVDADKRIDRVLADIDPENWRNVVRPLVKEADAQLRRERARVNEEKLRLMPLVTEQTPTSDDPTPTAVTSGPAPISSAPTKAATVPTTGPSVRKPFQGQVLNRDLAKWLRDRRDVLDTPFSLGDGRTTTIELATLEEHEQRVSTLLRTIEGTKQTVDLHVRIIENLRATGAKNLAEIMKQVQP